MLLDEAERNLLQDSGGAAKFCGAVSAWKSFMEIILARMVYRNLSSWTDLSGPLFL